MTASASRIGIVGAGASGRLVALHLLERATAAGAPLALTLFELRAPREVGPAYSCATDDLRLNVPAAKMGAYASDPEHFLRWACERGAPEEPLAFLPRRRYGEYLGALVDRAAGAASEPIAFARIENEVVDVEPCDGALAIRTADGARADVDTLVLAFGNFPPPSPLPADAPAPNDPRYVGDPWSSRALDDLAPDEPVVLIGTGQTTVDLAMLLWRRAHRGPVFAISRRGIWPLAHRGFDPYPSFASELEGKTRVSDLLAIVLRHVARAEASGRDARSVIDALRPETQRIWQALPIAEKRRFLRHVARHWETARSRIPPESQQTLDAMRAKGQLRTAIGRIRALEPTPASLDVRYVPRGSSSVETLRAARVVNCAGPESDLRRIRRPLVESLLRRGMVRPGPAGIGLDALPTGAVLDAEGAAGGAIYALGPPLKGVLWESVAIIEIRAQAEALARQLVDDASRRRGQR